MPFTSMGAGCAFPGEDEPDRGRGDYVYIPAPIEVE